MTTNFLRNQNELNPIVEQKFDKLIIGNNKKESVFSPLTYSPDYLEDNMAWDKLKGYHGNTSKKDSINHYVDHNYIYLNNTNTDKPENELESLKKNNFSTLCSPLIREKYHLNLNSNQGSCLFYS